MLTVLEKHFARQLCDPVGYNTSLSEAASRGKTIFEYRPGSSGAEGYRNLIRRVTDDDAKQEKSA
jgi:chromosome partitioning protein